MCVLYPYSSIFIYFLCLPFVCVCLCTMLVCVCVFVRVFLRGRPSSQRTRLRVSEDPSLINNCSSHHHHRFVVFTP